MRSALRVRRPIYAPNETLMANGSDLFSYYLPGVFHISFEENERSSSRALMEKSWPSHPMTGRSPSKPTIRAVPPLELSMVSLS
jgi:hypothetical protein